MDNFVPGDVIRLCDSHEGEAWLWKEPGKNRRDLIRCIEKDELLFVVSTIVQKDDGSFRNYAVRVLAGDTFGDVAISHFRTVVSTR